MQQNLLPHLDCTDKADKRTVIGACLEIEIIDGVYPKAKLYRSGIFIKHVDLSDKIAKRLFIIEAVELGAVVSKLARVLGISRQSVYNYIDIKKHFGIEGVINSYQPSRSKNLGKQRLLNKNKIPTGNKARILEEKRRKERVKREQDQEIKQLDLFTLEEIDNLHHISRSEQPYFEEHDWLRSRYAGIFLYIITMISKMHWLEFLSGYFGNAYKIFMVFILMVGRNIASIEQLKNVCKREASMVLGLRKLPSKPVIWQWFYEAVRHKNSVSLLYDYFRYQIHTGVVNTWLWFVDGHLLPYTGKEKVHYSYNTQRRIPVPGRTNLVVSDISGRIVDFEIQEGKGKLRSFIIKLHKKWAGHVPDRPLMVFDREGYGADFFNELIQEFIPFVTWDKYVDSRKLAAIEEADFTEEITVNGRTYAIFEGEKEFSCTVSGGKHKFTLRRIYIWNKTTNRRTCALSWTGDMEVSAAECGMAILNRWGASENTFKHLKDRHPFHYHPGFKMRRSERQEIPNPEVKEKNTAIKRLKRILNGLYKQYLRLKPAFNKDGSPRRNSRREGAKADIERYEHELKEQLGARNELPERLDVSGLEDYRSFKEIDNEGKNLFDFVTSSLWNVRKQMVDWLRPYFGNDNEVVDLFYAITNCHGWIKSSKKEVRVRLEPLEQPKRRAAQEQLCRKLTGLGARLPSGKWLVVEVGDSPL
jgi:hypothetical protein